MATNVEFGNYEPTEQEDFRVINVNIDVYFDGTLNNMYNSDEKKDNTDAFKKYGTAKKKDTSYYNDWSNVARLWEVSDQKTKIYVEGIGTEEKKKDSTMGFAYGSGNTGVVGKVEMGCEKIAQKVSSEKDKAGAEKVAVLTLDVFGFSRGSAAARNFVHEVGRQKHKSRMVPVAVGRTVAMQRQDDDGNPTTLEEVPAWGKLGIKLQEEGLEVDTIRVRFLGIFDTVSSYHPVFSLMPDFSNDVDELHLNHIGHARNVVHFTAENEHRQNFSLTHSPFGIEKSFPGVHSDIGGSYNDGVEVVEELETSWTLKSRLDPFKEKLIQDGWYKDPQLEITGGNMYWALQGTRDLKKSYSYIPLHFMAEMGIEKTLPFKQTVMEDKYKMSDVPLLTRVKSRLRKYVFDGGPAYSFIPESVMKPNDEQVDLRELRNGFLHWSARREGIGMDPNSDRKRIVY
jgi:hypothetical protein